MKNRGVRDQMVVATKYTTPYRATFGDKEIISNTGGNGTKSLHNSLQWSLDNLQTSCIDLVFSTSPLLCSLFIIIKFS
jgi:aryl-alcohol dehydrogenase-like predicted oxidoreductase